MNKSEVFIEYQSLLYSIGYNMLGLIANTKDLVQETYIKWMSADAEKIQNPKAYIAKIMTNKCIDHLSELKRERVKYVGQWLPEPLVNNSINDSINRVDLYHSLSMGLMVMLEKLLPLERAVFLLKEIFTFDYKEIAAILSRSEENCRQIFSRAKKHLNASEKRYKVDMAIHERVLHKFLQAVRDGDIEGLISLLKEDIVLVADGGGKSFEYEGKKFSAALNPITGARDVSKFLIGVSQKINTYITDVQQRIVLANDGLAIVTYIHGQPVTIVSLDIHEDRIESVFIQNNQEKLKELSI